tara:strand:+ start:28117 stop:30186 length:2070 start_codon:yes stop_codon:yes gene_type:complete
MVLAYLGRRVSLDETRINCSVARDGVNALTILRAARWYGLDAGGYRVEDDEDFKDIPRASILHWGFEHFLVFDRIDEEGVHLVDPALGRIYVPIEEFKRQFTGVVLTFEPTEDFEILDTRQKSPFYLLFDIIRESKSLGRIGVLSLLLLLLGIMVPALTSLIIDRIAPQSDHQLLTKVALGVGCVGLFYLATIFLRNRTLADMQIRVDAALAIRFMEHLAKLPYPFLEGRSAGDLMMRANSNERLRELISSDGLSALLDSIFVVAYLAAVMYWSPFVALIALGMGAIQLLFFIIPMGAIRELYSQTTQKEAKAQGLLTQLLLGMATFKASGGEETVTSDWANEFVDQLNCDVDRSRLEGIYLAVSSALEVGGIVVLTIAGAYEVLSGGLSLGEMLAVVALASGFLTPLIGLVRKMTTFLRASILLERLDDVLRTEPERTDGKEVTLRGGVEVIELGFSYSPASAPVLEDVSLTISPGEFVAIVGASGSGKSTLGLLLLGLYEPDEGGVLYDGVDLDDISLQSFRGQIGVVSQRSQLFAGTIRSNLLFGQKSQPTAAQVISAAKLACIHDDIMRMPEGYDSVISENGESLSGGQRQRLALARALVHTPKILFLDEATSALDTLTEARVQRNLSTIGCTTIVVAHRLSTIRRANTIFVMEEGELVESGNHDALMEEDGVYASLIDPAATAA